MIPAARVLAWGIEIRIRQARPADRDVIAGFNARLALETEHRRLELKRVRQGVAALLARPVRGVYFVAETGAAGARKVVGQLLITHEWSDWRNGNFWWIQSVYVAKPYRGRGVFRALFEHVEALARAQKDVCGLRLYMDAHNARARRSYERLGLKRTNYEVFEIDFVLENG